MGIITDALQWIGSFFTGIFIWLVNAIKGFFQVLIDVIVGFFEVIFDLIQGLLYLLYMIGFLAVKLFQVIFEAATILWSLIVGFGNTLGSLSYTPATTAGHGYSTVIGNVFDSLAPLNIEPFAYIALFGIWIMTAMAAMKLISSIRVGGS